MQGFILLFEFFLDLSPLFSLNRSCYRLLIFGAFNAFTLEEPYFLQEIILDFEHFAVKSDGSFVELLEVAFYNWLINGKPFASRASSRLEVLATFMTAVAHFFFKFYDFYKNT